MPVVISIESKPLDELAADAVKSQSESKKETDKAKAPKDLAWKKDAYDTISKAIEILKSDATEDVKEVAQHLDMALEALNYQPETDPDTQDMMGSKKDPMEDFGDAEEETDE